jgi:phage baseplate assembly protein gpV
MNDDLIRLLRAVVRDELARLRAPEVGLVTSVQPRDSAGSDANHQVNVRLAASGLELQAVPVTVGRLGFSMLPQVGDSVLVAFAQGELNAPLVIGSLYDANVQPPVAKAGEVIYAPSDAGGDKSLRRLQLALGADVTLTADDETLTFTLGQTEVTVAKDGDVTINSAAKLVIQTQGDASIEAGGKLELKAQGEVRISGSVATVEGQSAATLKGPSVKLAGNTQFSPG